MDWKDSLGYSNKNFTESIVGGKPQNFYPISVAMMFELRGIAKPLATAVAVLFDEGKGNIGTVNRITEHTIPDPDAKKPGISQKISEYVQQPMDASLATLRLNTRSKAVADICDAFTDASNREVVAKIIMDSLREVFKVLPDTGVGIAFDVTAKEFLRETPLPLMTDYIQGLFKANKAVLGPFADLLEKLWTQGVAMAKEKVLSPSPENSQTASVG